MSNKDLHLLRGHGIEIRVGQGKKPVRVFHIKVPLELGELLDKLAREDGVPVEQYIAGILESAHYDELPTPPSPSPPSP